MTIFTFLGRASTAFWTWLVRGGWKFLAAILAAFLLYKAVTGLAERDALRDDLVAAQAQVETIHTTAIAADRAVTGNSGAKALLTQKETAGLARTNDALEAHRDWASQPIPADVLDSLRD